ncbi:MAG: hypothetical protein Q8R15_05000 [Candidatus Micrarchaeota archaeon]|nr:hypothetical protein [Candidatus Micrarchaeota archaeon]
MVRTIEAAVGEINKARSRQVSGTTSRDFQSGPFVNLTTRKTGVAQEIYLELRTHDFVSGVGYTTKPKPLGNALALLLHESPQTRLEGKWKEKLRKAGYEVEEAPATPEHIALGAPADMIYGFHIHKKNRKVGQIILNPEHYPAGILAKPQHFLPIVRTLFAGKRGRK